ncbi:hypothetical protein F2P56_020051 [Juglans regia]|uniref:Transcription factor MYB3-like n=2 Tax=Juglans regia TaxID=51240 RepID=A0A2I4F061_JUGRE|nr:transcription factor MYB3-like [Juglans regia]KAF5460164.1 hypothetical protein F2P56_020051 [Juglans regia]
MAPKNVGSSAKKVMNKGTWTAEEDQKLSQYIEIHGAKRWEIAAATAGLNRCGKSCRLRWLNYLRPNIKRGNISDAEEDLILRLHKLLGNRWSLIAGRLPGRTDNEIKNYWNSHLNKKINRAMIEKTLEVPTAAVLLRDRTEITMPQKSGASINDQVGIEAAGGHVKENGNTELAANSEFTELGSCTGLEWANKFLELDDDAWLF